MKSALAPVTALLLGVSILLTGQGLQGTLLPVRATLESFSTISIGVMGAAYFLGFTLGCLKGGELVKRVGHIRVFAAMTAMASAIPLLHGMLIDPWLWTILRMFTGFCFAILYLVIESWLNERSTNETRGLVFSVYVFITLTVLAGGQMLTLSADPRELQLFALASVLVSLAALPVVLSTSPSPELPTSVSVDLRKLWRISPAGTLGCLATGLANGSFWALAPVFTQGVSGDTSLAAWFMTSAVLGGAIAQAPIGLIADRIGRRNMLFISATSGGIIALLIVVASAGLGFIGLNVLAALWGAFAFPLYTLSIAHANDNAEVDDYVTMSAGLLLMYGAGAVIGPFAASALMTQIDASGLYMFTAIAHFALLIYVAHRALRRGVAPIEAHITYSDALASAATASQVYEEEIQQVVDEDPAKDAT